MPYGIAHSTTIEWLEKRAKESGIDFEKLGIEPDFSQWYDENGKQIYDLPFNLYEITVIFGGALDESFYILTDYEVNIADWIAEQCREEASKQSDESWEIIVSEYAHEDGGPVRYRVSSES